MPSGIDFCCFSRQTNRNLKHQAIPSASLAETFSLCDGLITLNDVCLPTVPEFSGSPSLNKKSSADQMAIFYSNWSTFNNLSFGSIVSGPDHDEHGRQGPYSYRMKVRCEKTPQVPSNQSIDVARGMKRRTSRIRTAGTYT